MTMTSILIVSPLYRRSCCLPACWRGLLFPQETAAVLDQRAATNATPIAAERCSCIHHDIEFPRFALSDCDDGSALAIRPFFVWLRMKSKPNRERRRSLPYAPRAME